MEEGQRPFHWLGFMFVDTLPCRSYLCFYKITNLKISVKGICVCFCTDTFGSHSIYRSLTFFPADIMFAYILWLGFISNFLIVSYYRITEIEITAGYIYEWACYVNELEIDCFLRYEETNPLQDRWLRALPHRYY